MHLLQIGQCEVVLVLILAPATACMGSTLDTVAGTPAAAAVAVGGTIWGLELVLVERSAGTSFISVPVSMALKDWIIFDGSFGFLHSVVLFFHMDIASRPKYLVM